MKYLLTWLSYCILVVICLCIKYKEIWALNAVLIEEYFSSKSELNSTYYLPVTVFKPSLSFSLLKRRQIAVFIF